MIDHPGLSKIILINVSGNSTAYSSLCQSGAPLGDVKCCKCHPGEMDLSSLIPQGSGIVLTIPVAVGIE